MISMKSSSSGQVDDHAPFWNFVLNL